jgi:hypothetical protein
VLRGILIQHPLLDSCSRHRRRHVQHLKHILLCQRRERPAEVGA